jgi:hypothetical protein
MTRPLGERRADHELSEWSVSSAKDPGKAEGKAMGERLMVQTLYKKVRVMPPQLLQRGLGCARSTDHAAQVISCFPEGYASSNTVSRESECQRGQRGQRNDSVLGERDTDDV